MADPCRIGRTEVHPTRLPTVLARTLPWDPPTYREVPVLPPLICNRQALSPGGYCWKHDPKRLGVNGG